MTTVEGEPQWQTSYTVSPKQPQWQPPQQQWEPPAQQNPLFVAPTNFPTWDD